ncbi:MAG: flagellar basal-body rod protein FlgF [Rhizobacter sp.]|nr:flagellar basal-body rod protein FlgF [Rhizobacter sp.]
MIESIYVGMSGLMGYSQGLRVIANNTANLNTPGFKGSDLQFADMFYANSTLSGNGSGYNRMQLGYGLNTYSTSINFKQGELRQTGNDLDVAVDGQGLFMLRDKDDGELRYSRAGQFEFNADGLLVNRADGAFVLGFDASNTQGRISLEGLRTNAPRATSEVSFSGNLSSTETTRTISNISVIDSIGGQHTLSMTFTRNAAPAQTTWTVAINEGTTSVGTGSIEFINGQPTTATERLNVTYTPVGLASQPLSFDFSGEVTSFASGTTSTLAAARQDGIVAGALTKVSFDDKGALVVTYNNGQTATGARLALSRFDSPDAIEPGGDNQFRPTNSNAWHVGTAGADGFGSVKAGTIEISNVDLSQEFSDLVIMQRGYQASSQVISTANDMLQELFSMKGGR